MENVKPFLASKTTNHSKITLVENEKVINDDTKAAETLNSFFTEAVFFNLKIPKYKTSSIVMDENKSSKDIHRIIEKHNYHPSVTGIKQAFPDLSFSFKPVVRGYIKSTVREDVLSLL